MEESNARRASAVKSRLVDKFGSKLLIEEEFKTKE